MNKKQLILSCVTLAFFAGLAGQANAHDVTSEKTVKAATKATETAKKTKAVNSKTAKKTKAVNPASATPVVAKDVPASVAVQQPAPVQRPATANVPAQPANPYLASQSSNPYLAGQQNTNPYLANRPANPWLVAPSQTLAQTQNVAAPVAMPQQVVQQAARPVVAQVASPQVNAEASGRRHISLSPLPVDIYMNPGIRPAVAFTTPCIKIAKLTNNFPPLMAFEHLMFDIIGKVNESEALPFSLEPVCT